MWFVIVFLLILLTLRSGLLHVSRGRLVESLVVLGKHILHDVILFSRASMAM